MLQTLKELEEIKYVAEIAPNDSVITRASLAFLDGPHDTRVPASGLDLILYKSETAWEKIIETAKKIPYNDIIYRNYPELYRDYCEHESKKSELLAITEREIEKLKRLDQKMMSL